MLKDPRYDFPKTDSYSTVRLLSACAGTVTSVLLVEGDDGLGDGQTDGHDLGGGTTASYANADVKVLEALSTEEQDGLESLEAEGSGLEELEGLSVNLDEASALGGVGNSGGVLLSSKALDLLDFVFGSHLSLL